MKKTNILPVGLLAAVALASLAQIARATAYTSGDLVLGFEEPGNSENYVVDLGPASTFISLAGSAGTTDITTADFSGAGLGNIAADLGSQFGSTWYANSNTAGSNLQWGVFGSTKGFGGNFGLPGNTLFETVAELTPGGGSTVPLEASASTQGTINSNFVSFTGVINGLSATSNSTHASFESSSLSNSWTGEDAALAAFHGPIGIEQPESGNYIGPTNSQLDLYELQPSTSPNAPATLLGDFTLTNTGQLEFTSAAAVPEPATCATVGLGAAILLLFRRRRAAPAQS